MQASAVEVSENPSSCWSDGSFRKLKGYCYNFRSIVRLWQSRVTLKRWRAVTQIQLSRIIHAVVRNVNQTDTTVVFISDVQRTMTHYNTHQTPVYPLCLSPIGPGKSGAGQKAETFTPFRIWSGGHGNHHFLLKTRAYAVSSSIAGEHYPSL